MPPALRRFAGWSFLVTEIGLVAAGSAYVGVGTRDFWLMLTSAVMASIAYVATVRMTRDPKLGDVTSSPQRWYWF